VKIAFLFAAHQASQWKVDGPFHLSLPQV